MKNLNICSNMITGNQRLNGYVKSSSSLSSQSLHKTFPHSGNTPFNEADNVCFNHFGQANDFIADFNFKKEFKSATNSIIGLNNEDNSYKVKKVQRKKSKFRSLHHETLQRIESINDDQYNHYQKHWFSAGLERLKIEDRSREERLEITRYELKRQLRQLLHCNVGKESQLPQMFRWKEVVANRSTHRGETSRKERLVGPRNCEVVNCQNHALPCARHCTLHIMLNQDQVLFNNCTAKFADNTQCSVPVFDILHELPLCTEHARKRDNYKMYQEAKPKKIRKKAKPSAMIRPQKRTKKKKKSICLSDVSACDMTGLNIDVPKASLLLQNTPITGEILNDVHDESEDLGVDMVDQVLALQEPDALELGNVDQVLVTQASQLLEEPDITNVLSTIQADEFNDFFTVNRNGEYEPTREETEELERALAAVDNDVKSLEKLSQSQGLLDTFLDDQNLVESLVHSSIVPDVFHNGFSTCGENIVGQTSRLLSVQHNSHS